MGAARALVSPETVRPRPFLKWVGGKGRLLSDLEPLLPTNSARRQHFEPFAGGAALFFNSDARRCWLSDVNEALMATYKAVRDEVEDVIPRLRLLATQHSHEHYYRVRERFNARTFDSVAELAAAFVYLNKTCYNGLYRVNRAGHFNVPIGSYKNPAILDVGGLRSASARLQHASIGVGGFEDVLLHASRGDFVYLDPPYVPSSTTASFRSYAPRGFTLSDHARLRDVFCELAERGVYVLLSNSDTAFVRNLYKGWNLSRLSVRRSVSAAVSSRGAVGELVVRNYA